jgi:hypothetical protein
MVPLPSVAALVFRVWLRRDGRWLTIALGLSTPDFIEELAHFATASLRCNA